MERKIHHFDKLPAWLGVYITTRPEAPITSKLQRFSPWELLPEHRDNREDVRLFFAQLLREVGVDPAGAAEVLVEKSGGLFVYAAMAAERLRAARRGGEAVTPEQIRAFPDGLDDFYEEQMARICGGGADVTDTLEWRTVEMATAAVEPLHVELVQLLLGCSAKERKSVVARLSRFFPIRDRRLHVYHKSVRDWLVREDREGLGSCVKCKVTPHMDSTYTVVRPLAE